MTIKTVQPTEVATPHGIARVHLRPVEKPVGALVMGHGAGGGVTSTDLVTATETALAHQLSVALVEQPYRVAGRRSPAPAHQLDTAWIAVLEYLRGDPLNGLRLIVGGRSMGARVACRTADSCGAIGVLCLAFPLHPPGKADPSKSRLAELDRVRVPTLVVQGDRDPFGMPPPGPSRTVAVVAGDHSLRKDRTAIVAAISRWLKALPPLR